MLSRGVIKQICEQKTVLNFVVQVLDISDADQGQRKDSNQIRYTLNVTDGGSQCNVLFLWHLNNLIESSTIKKGAVITIMKYETKSRKDNFIPSVVYLITKP